MQYRCMSSRLGRRDANVELLHLGHTHSQRPRANSLVLCDFVVMTSRYRGDLSPRSQSGKCRWDCAFPRFQVA